MSRFLPLLSALVALLAPLAPGWAADSGLTQEIHELRRDLQMQTKKIEALTQQLAELGKIIKERDATKPSAEPPLPPGSTAIVPLKDPPAVRETKPAATAEIPKAVPVPPAIPHVVAKGDTLTSIAKHYNVALADLLRLNKNTNDRKLQIGQTLKVPAPARPAETQPTETAPENP